MNRKYLLSILLIFALAGCNFPAATTPELTPDLVASQVALQLTQQATATPQGGTNATQPPAPTAQPAASATASQPTAAATATLTPAPSSTPGPTATTPSTDPKASLGNPAWSDSFTNAKSWGLDTPYDDGNTHIEIKNNAMVLTSAAAIGWHGWRFSYLKPQDFYLEATITTGACSSSDLYGVVFRSPDQETGYWFGVTCDGRFNLRSGGVNDFTDIAKYTASSAILSGANQTNRLGVYMKGSKISLYANGKPLGDFNDTTYTDAGVFGLFIAGYKTMNFSVQCTQIAYWNLP